MIISNNLNYLNFRSNSCDTKVLYDTKFLQLKSTPSPDGKFPWVYAHRPNTGSQDAVVIAPIIHKNEDGDSIMFIKTNRVPITAEGKAKGCIELPAGLIGDEKGDETPEEALKKELLEETGYVSDSVSIENHKVASTPGCVSETSSIAVADIYNEKPVKEPVSDGGVIVDRCEVPLDKVNNWIKDQAKQGYIITAQALSGLYYAMSRNNNK